MSLTNEERQIMVTLEMEKADRFFIQAKKNAEIQEWDVVANRLILRSVSCGVCLVDS